MKLKWLLLFIPIAVGLSWLKVNPIIVFIASSLAIIPLSNLMGDATEELGRSLGSAKSGLLNSTMGTVPDIIIGFFALQHGLIEMVKASITGAIIGNLLFGLGLSILAGGLKIKNELKFDLNNIHLYSGLLLLATIGLIIPAAFEHTVESDIEISLLISIILFFMYFVSVFFTLTQNVSELTYLPPLDHASADNNKSLKSNPLIILLLVGIGLAVMSEIMTDSIGPTANSLGFSPLFAGIFLLAPIGMISELINSVRFARQNQLDISLAITMGSTTQIALLVAPLLVFFGLILGQPMDLLFSKFEVIAIILSVVTVNHALHLGSVQWVSGPKLIAIYLILGVAFFNIP